MSIEQEPPLKRHLEIALDCINACLDEGGFRYDSLSQETRDALAFFESLTSVQLRQVSRDGRPYWIARDVQPVHVSDSLHVGFFVPESQESPFWRPGGATAIGLALIAADADALAKKAREDAEYERTGPMAWEDDARAIDWRKRNGVQS
jgi:hypothetical protein